MVRRPAGQRGTSPKVAVAAAVAAAAAVLGTRAVAGSVVAVAGEAASAGGAADGAIPTRCGDEWTRCATSSRSPSA